MRIIKQMLRQPLKTISGVLIVALAVAILVICVGQYAATVLTRSNLDDRYHSVALPSDTYFWQKDESGKRVHLANLPAEIQEWIDDTVQNRPDLVQSVSTAGLVSAYIPDISIDNFSQYENGDRMGEYNIGNPYRCAMLEVTLTKIGTVISEDVSTFISGDVEQELLNHSSVLCMGTVENVVGLEDGFDSPVGKTILLTVRVYDEENFRQLQLHTGRRYLVYGMDYSDMLGGEFQTQILNHLPAYEELLGKAALGALGYDLDPYMERIDCTMTVCDYSSLPWNTTVYDDSGAFSGFTSSANERPLYYADSDGYHMTAISAEEYIADYRVPTIAPLNSSATDFLASEKGVLWRKALEEVKISNHGFPVLAVDKLGYQAAFSRELARIVEGRDFTESERLNGDSVCILSESLAAANGLRVGDAIELRTYAYDPNIEVQRDELMNSTAFPSAAVYSGAMGFTSQMETYTIVGLYRLENAWQNQNDSYGFTPNTVFVPKAAVSSEMLPHTEGIYSTLIIKNGKMAAFQKLQEEAGYPGLFICMDQGYTEIVSALDAYEGVSANVLYIGIAGSAVIMILFLILFPLQHGKTLAIMSALGASRGSMICYVVLSSISLLLPGCLFGGFAGAVLWEQVAASLMASVNVQIPLEADMTVLAPSLALASFGLMTMLASVAGIVMSGDRKLMKRK